MSGGVGSRRVVVRADDVNFDNYALREGAEPDVSGKPLNMQALAPGFRSLPKFDQRYSEIYELAFKKASQKHREDPSVHVADYALRLSDKLIAELESKNPKRKVAKMPVDLDLSYEADDDDDDAGLAEIDELFAAVSKGNSKKKPVRPKVNDFNDDLAWPEDGFTSDTPEPSDWLSLPGLGPEPQPYKYAVRFQTTEDSLVIPCQWLFQNSQGDGQQIESIAAVTDLRYERVNHVGKLLSVKRAGAARLQVADMHEGRISREGIDTFDVADVAWGVEIGDLSVAVFFVSQ